jgi:SPP1 gp7 family putative phage head morphogenesis protein
MDLIHKKLTKQQKQNREVLAVALAALFLGVSSPLRMMMQAPVLAASFQKRIASLHASAQELANGETPETVPVETVDPLLTMAAAMGVVSTVIGTTQVLTQAGKGFQDAVSGALEAVGPRLNTIATTETFGAFSKQVRANTAESEGVWSWDATLDRRTCPRCASLHGKTWDRLGDVPSIPAHINCRCFLKFQS